MLKIQFESYISLELKLSCRPLKQIIMNKKMNFTGSYGIKCLFVGILVTLSKVLIAQEISFNDLSRITERGEYTSYVASDGGVYKIGDKLKIGFPSSNKTFAFITEGDGFLIPITPLNVGNSGQDSEIKKIFVSGNKRAGFSVFMRTKGLVGTSNYTIQFENALATGEVKGFGLTSDEALDQLKRAKDKLELGLITKDEFEQLKLDLSKYIK